MSRRIENREVLERGSGESNFLSFKDVRKIITPRETRQNLLLMAPILISHTIISNGDITLETTIVLKISMTLLQDIWPFFAVFLSLSCTIPS